MHYFLKVYNEKKQNFKDLAFRLIISKACKGRRPKELLRRIYGDNLTPNYLTALVNRNEELSKVPNNADNSSGTNNKLLKQ